MQRDSTISSSPEIFDAVFKSKQAKPYCAPCGLIADKSPLHRSTAVQ